MAEPIRVVMAGDYPREQGKPGGGPESVAEVLADGLAASGSADVSFVTSVVGLKKPEHRRTAAGVEVHMVPAVERYATWTNYYRDRRRIQAVVADIDPDIVHLHGTMGATTYSLLEREYPSVLAIRGIWFREIPFERGLLRQFKDRYKGRFEISALRRARHAICLNRYTCSSVARWLGDAKVRYIDNPVDDSFFEIENQEEYGRILLLAVVRRLKGHEFLIKAVGRLKLEGRNVKLYCVGPALDRDYFEEIGRLVAHNDLADCVHFQSRASRAEVLQHYSRAQVVVLPSLVENAPLVVSEAMAAGKAIVATPAGGVPEMIEDSRTGLIAPASSPDALADAIGRLLDSPESSKALGDAAKDVAEHRFRRSVAVQKTLAFYRDILGGNGGTD